jgi:ATP-binding cassette, subfamily C, bacterial CydD
MTCMSATVSWLEEWSRPGRRPLLAAVALGEASGILMILQTALLAWIGNAVIFSTAAPLAPAFAALLAAVALRSAALWGARTAAQAAASAAKQAVRAEVVAALRRIGPVTLAGMEAGRVVHTAVDAVEGLDAYYARYLPQRAVATVFPFTVLAVVFPLDWVSGLVLVLTAVFLPVSMVLIGGESLARNQKVWGRLAAMSGRFLDSIQGLATLRMFGAARREAAEIARMSEEYRRTAMSALRVAFVSAFALELIASVSIAIVAVLSGFRMFSGTMDFARGYFVLLLAPEYFLTLRALGTSYHARMEAVSAAEQIRQVLAAAPAAPAAAAAASSHLGRGGRHGGMRPPRVVLQGVSADYGRGPVLEAAELTVEPGERVALVGASGCGKSTILALLLGFVAPARGHVLVDGEDLASLDREGWLRRVAWLAQRPTVFHGTLAENILLGRLDADDAAVAEAARLACVDEFASRRPDGLAAAVGEGGAGLSVGQAQRVALARLFLRDPGLVLLDEPTAHLDAASARLVAEAVDRLAAGRTCIIATHRPIEGVDRVVQVEGGHTRPAVPRGGAA